MTNSTTTPHLPEDQHKAHRIKLLGQIFKEQLFRAKGNHGLYRLTATNTVERCNSADEGHVQFLMDNRFAYEETRSVTRYLDPQKQRPIRLNAVFLGGWGRDYLGTHQHVR